jgi:hypothetical protein
MGAYSLAKHRSLHNCHFLIYSYRIKDLLMKEDNEIWLHYYLRTRR